MAHERSLARIAQRQQGTPMDVATTQANGVLSGEIMESSSVPTHLRGPKENYDTAIIGTEIQRRKRRHGNATIRDMANDTKDAMGSVVNSTMETRAYVASLGLSEAEYKMFCHELREVDGITFDALMDGLEESALIVNLMTDTNPLEHQVARAERRGLSFKERMTGRIEG